MFWMPSNLSGQGWGDLDERNFRAAIFAWNKRKRPRGPGRVPGVVRASLPTFLAQAVVDEVFTICYVFEVPVSELGGVDGRLRLVHRSR